MPDPPPPPDPKRRKAAYGRGVANIADGLRVRRLAAYPPPPPPIPGGICQPTAEVRLLVVWGCGRELGGSSAPVIWERPLVWAGPLYRGILTDNDPLFAPGGHHVQDGSSPDSESQSPDACKSMAVPAEAGLASSGGAGVTDVSVGTTDGTRAGALWKGGCALSHASDKGHVGAVHKEQAAQGCNLEHSRCWEHWKCVSHSGSPRQHVRHLLGIL